MYDVKLQRKKIFIVVALFLLSALAVSIVRFVVLLPTDNRVEDYVYSIERKEYREAYDLLCPATRANLAFDAWRASVAPFEGSDDQNVGRGDDEIVPINGELAGTDVWWQMPVWIDGGQRYPCPSTADLPFGPLEEEESE